MEFWTYTTLRDATRRSGVQEGLDSEQARRSRLFLQHKFFRWSCAALSCAACFLASDGSAIMATCPLVGERQAVTIK